MAFAVLHSLSSDAQVFPFLLDGCHTSCHGAARARACSRGCGTRGWARRPFSFGDNVAREFELVDTPESSFIYVDVSDFKREHLSVWISEGRLHVSASKNDGVVVEKSWTLPENSLEDGISAKLADSELTIILPKQPAPRPARYQVPIEDGFSPAAEMPAAGDDADAEVAGASHSRAAAQADMEVDGTWVDVADEDIAKAKAKGKASVEGSVVEDAQQEQPGPSNS